MSKTKGRAHTDFTDKTKAFNLRNQRPGFLGGHLRKQCTARYFPELSHEFECKFFSSVLA